MKFIRGIELLELREMIDIMDISQLIDKDYFDVQKNPKQVIINLCDILNVSQIDTVILCEQYNDRERKRDSK